MLASRATMRREDRTRGQDQGQRRDERLPRFFLATDSEDGPPRFAPGEFEHATKVLRLKPGDPFLGLDGQGSLWRLELGETGRHAAKLHRLGPPLREPAPGEEGAPLPWVELAVAWPKRPRADPMLRTLVQLGVAAIVPLDCSWSGAQKLPARGDERLVRILQDACKQSERTWLPEIGPGRTVAELLEERGEAAIALLDPRHGMGFDTWLRSIRTGLECLGTAERPITLCIGPEGGFSPEETELFLLAGAQPVLLGPHVLRIETAAVAAMAVVGSIYT